MRSKARTKLLAAHAAFLSRRFFPDELQLHRLRAAELADFEHNSFRPLLANPDDAARQVPDIRPHVYYWILSCASEFALERSEAGEPFAVLMHFGGTRRGELSERAIELIPLVGIRFHGRYPYFQGGSGSAAIVVRGP